MRSGRAFTTEEMIHYERDTIQVIRGAEQHAPIANFETRREIEQRPLASDESQPASSKSCRAAIRYGAGRSRRRGKNYFLSVVREAAEREVTK